MAEGLFGQGHVAVALALAGPDVEEHPLGIDVAHFGRGQDDGQLEARVGPNQFDLGGPKPAQGFFPEELDGADGLGGGLAGDLLLAFEEDEILAKFLRRDVLGGFVVVVGELADAVPVGLLRAVADGQELQVIGVGF